MANGYSPSIMQEHTDFCYLCGATSGKLDRHEPFGAANRQKSKHYGMWCMLCHDTCHLNGAHKDASIGRELKAQAQAMAMETYGWTTEEFIKIFGKSFI